MYEASSSPEAKLEWLVAFEHILGELMTETEEVISLGEFR